MQIEVAGLLLQPELIVVVALVAVAGDALVPVLPSGSLVLAAASFSLGHGPAALALALAVASASFLGDLALLSVVRFRSGRSGTRPARHTRTAAAAEQLRDALTGRLGRTTLAARFVPGGRTMLGLVLADAPERRGAYLRWSALGGLVWAGCLVGIACLNSLWSEARWIGFAVSVPAGVVISALLARAVRRSGALTTGPKDGTGRPCPGGRAAAPPGQTLRHTPAADRPTCADGTSRGPRCRFPEVLLTPPRRRRDRSLPV
ncbi:hypothetical protein ACFXOK_09340 [Streptomyces sp. NPDC059173]|uniref:hypothetical protein n=1 Tax=unclassified Streptomyces TaxID=2593676 RepID=UPI0036C75000